MSGGRRLLGASLAALGGLAFLLWLAGSVPRLVVTRTPVVRDQAGRPGAASSQKGSAESGRTPSDQPGIDQLIARFETVQEVCDNDWTTLECGDAGCTLLFDAPDGRWERIWHDVQHPRRWAEDRVYGYLDIPWASPCFEAFGPFAKQVVAMSAGNVDDPNVSWRSCYALVPGGPQLPEEARDAALRASAATCDALRDEAVFAAALE